MTQKSRLIEILREWFTLKLTTDELVDKILSSGFVHKDEIRVCKCVALSQGINEKGWIACDICQGKGFYVKEEKI